MKEACSVYPNEMMADILGTIEEINHLNDVDAILDRILYETRRLSNADAGSIFLLEENTLKFSYVHNDTLFREDEANVELYSEFKVPADQTSIVGYSALTGDAIVIDDAYNMPDNLPYKFNPAYDKRSGYKTTSILAIPLKTIQDRLVGVIQLINSKNENGESVPFPAESQNYVPFFANNAAVAIERGLMTRELILRMMKIAELRDPSETGAHVQRVGAYSSEIYHRYALNQGVDKKEIKRARDLIRLASMLHDVGKVGISDNILKKPAKLDEAEYRTMKCHTVYGARLFVNTTSELDKMSRDIALNHHEKWDGTGYPGRIPDLMADPVDMGAPKKGEDIPLAARITALADVFDALAAKRAYKDPWPDEKILSVIEEDAGTHFDPGVVEAFFQIFDVIKAIREKYK